MLMRTSSQCASSHNRFLTQLSREDAALLEGALEHVALPAGTLLLANGAPLEAIYFPETMIVSIGGQAFDGHHVETALIGFEGIVGCSAFAGSQHTTYDAIVQMKGGTAWRISRSDIEKACLASGTLTAAAMRFADVLSVQMAQAIISSLQDPVKRRLCRWLLMRHDRVLTDQFLIRHDEISLSLGTRRASVTDCLHILEGEHLVRCHRGRIIIRDRPGLEAAAFGSYGAAEAYYRERIGPFGRTISLWAR